jgi:hypothetical protein
VAISFIGGGNQRKPPTCPYIYTIIVHVASILVTVSLLKNKPAL